VLSGCKARGRGQRSFEGAGGCSGGVAGGVGDGLSLSCGLEGHREVCAQE
jgi:hypothetical protein